MRRGAEAVDALVRGTLGDERYGHSLRVADCAAKLCIRFGLESESGYLAGLAHDAARELPGEEVLRLAAADGLGISAMEAEHPVLLHGRASAVIVAGQCGVGDTEVLQAIRDHVTGRPSMGPLSKVLLAADFLEEGRRFHPDGFRREALALGLDAMVSLVIERKIRYVRAAARPVAAASLALREELGRDD